MCAGIPQRCAKSSKSRICWPSSRYTSFPYMYLSGKVRMEACVSFGFFIACILNVALYFTIIAKPTICRFVKTDGWIVALYLVDWVQTSLAWLQWSRLVTYKSDGAGRVFEWKSPPPHTHIWERMPVMFCFFIEIVLILTLYSTVIADPSVQQIQFDACLEATNQAGGPFSM